MCDDGLNLSRWCAIRSASGLETDQMGGLAMSVDRPDRKLLAHRHADAIYPQRTSPLADCGPKPDLRTAGRSFDRRRVATLIRAAHLS